MSILKRTIVLTGGGSAGHVTVNLALIPELLSRGWQIHYIGSDGIEKQLISDVPEVTYHTVATGKFRRYLDWRHLKDPFMIMKGTLQSYRLIRKIKPNVLFSKGGFVSVPVVTGAYLNRTPIMLHESDYTPGLANKLCNPMASHIFTTFPETASMLPAKKATHAGAIIRKEVMEGRKERGLHACDFVSSKPVLLVMGGSLGARRINEAVRNCLDSLLESYQIVHLCGKGNVDPTIQRRGYCQFEYVKNELADLLAMADLVISRAGSNSIYELLALGKPMLLIPLSKQASRGDQILNAASFEKAGYAHVLQEEDLTEHALLEAVNQVQTQRQNMQKAMQKYAPSAALEKVISTLERVAN